MMPMAAEGFDDALLDMGKWPGWRCRNCGERIALLIVANRSAAHGGTRTDLRPWT